MPIGEALWNTISSYKGCLRACIDFLLLLAGKDEQSCSQCSLMACTGCEHIIDRTSCKLSADQQVSHQELVLQSVTKQLVVHGVGVVWTAKT